MGLPGSHCQESSIHQTVCHPATVEGDVVVGDCQGVAMDEPVGKVATVDATVIAVGLVGGGGLAAKGPPR